VGVGTAMRMTACGFLFWLIARQRSHFCPVRLVAEQEASIIPNRVGSIMHGLITFAVTNTFSHSNSANLFEVPHGRFLRFPLLLETVGKRIIAFFFYLLFLFATAK
jgi:hypothetical protein